jgi:short subunit dehydrogenase-like uncharacterized protein
MGQWEEMAASAESRRVVEDPYALSPDRAAEPDLGDQRDLDWFGYDGDLGNWVGPFLMAGLNTRVVRRSNALQDWAYGRRFRYREVTGFGASPAAAFDLLWGLELVEVAGPTGPPTAGSGPLLSPCPRRSTASTTWPAAKCPACGRNANGCSTGHERRSSAGRRSRLCHTPL